MATFLVSPNFSLQVSSQMKTTVVQRALSNMDNKTFQRQYSTLSACRTIQGWKFQQNCTGKFSKLLVKPSMGSTTSFFLTKRSSNQKLVSLALNTGGTADNGAQDSENSGNNTGGGLGQTRLGRIASAGGKQLLEKLNATRKNFPLKIFLLLLGFYTANALATILGQTGDWDVLVAGVVVAAIEGIGMLMYKKTSMLFVSNNKRFKNLMVLVNYWKAGVCLGLFVDAFKLGS